ncbi:SpaA isopeptide-forming pilin-related protein [uncultured Subdoligranulum sp.]|uniref:SpaA isopeptide-forming pilin-related protein n=1 Tax=uncultured Subdoligranulum sp. TaxID=512298 RepID=UPI002607376E|nr:SpaA isopeptide-forming pilin-related protein [uncultured Subdoligranulum sp.]
MSNHFTKLWKRGLALLLAGVLSLSNLGGAFAFAESTPPQESAVAATAETAATPETALSPEAQVFVDAVNALDRESILAAVRQWAIASATWQAEPDNAELEAALNEAIEASDAASAPVYATEDLYYAIQEEEQQSDEVQAAYTALAALVASMQLAMEQPELPDTGGAPPDDEEIYDVLYDDLPDAPTGSYIGSMGLPIATGETRISISEWVTDLYDGVDAHIDAAALHADGEIITVDRMAGEDYAIVPIMVQVEYPANGSTTEIILPDSVTLLDYEGNAADGEETENILRASYTDTSAAAHGIYVQAAQDFTAEFVYTAPDGTELSKSLEVKVSDGGTNPIVTAKSGISTYAAEPTPPFTTGKITSIAFEGGTWLIWFNGIEAYCCSHGLSGQPNGCPTYSFAYVSKLEPGQYTPGSHYANQINIWGGLNQLSLGLLEEKHSGASATTYGLANDAAEGTAYRYYDDTQLWIMEHYPDSLAAQTYRASAQALAEHSNGNGFTTYSGENGYYTYIYTPPAGYAWQTVAIVGEEITEEGGTDVPDIPESQYYASWSAGPQTASGTLDLSYGLDLHKIGLVTGETIDEATFEITPSATSGSIDGGSWSLSPAGSQTVTTGGHVMDDTYHTTGGNASASWTLHYTVSKTSGTASGNVGPYSSQEEANAAASAAQSEAVSRLQGEAQAVVDAAIVSARSQLANITFTVKETSVPHGFDAYTGSTGSEQQVSVPADGSTDVTIHNEEWSVQVNIAKIDSETHQPIAADAEFAVFEWDTVEQMYIPFGGYNQYTVIRNEDGSYSVANGSSYATGSPVDRTLYYTQRNEGKFIIVETRAPKGYYGDWTDITHSGTAGQVEGKHAYAFTISKGNDGSVIDLSNKDYNADIGTADSGGTLLRTPEGNTVTATLYDAPQDATRIYTTDSTGLADNEDSYTSTPIAGKFTNDRVIGEIVLTKSDLDQAVEGADTALHGTSSIEGAVYDLYAAEDIQHPDGVSGVVDYSKIVNTNGDSIWHTTVLTNGGWDTDYLPVLAKDHLVASAEIRDGVLAFANLYLGKYYLVERATGIVLPLDGDGQYYVSGQYPVLDRTLQPTGEYEPLAVNSHGEYTDYVYKNLYSSVAEGRALSGVKTYDGYYLSFAEGYLCDEINHYSTLAYGSESQYIIRSDDYSNDAVLKSGFSIQKVVSTTGPGTPAPKLEGAGFTVYRVWELSKADQFTLNPDGTYNVQSILDAYRKDSYDNNTPKYDFSSEGAAVARMYESDKALVEEYNATLTAAYDYANGQGEGWVPTKNTNEYRLSELFTNEEGIIRVTGLPYGQYLVVETTLPKDLFQADPFVVTVDSAAPQSVLCQPDGSVTTPSNSYMTYNVLNEELEGYLQLIKIDAETGKPVKIADTAFQIYKIEEDGTETLLEMPDPDSGSATAKTSTFYTDADGYLKTPEKLPLGRYRVVEIEGPEGFFNDEQYNVVFELTSERVWEVVGNATDDMDDYIITEEYSNHETLGQLTIRKVGNVLTGYEDGQFIYEQANLAGATYEIRAHGDIATGDRQGTLWYADGDLIATVTTGATGQVDEVRFSPTRTPATYDFLTVSHDGTTGEVTITLPLGSYDITEVQAPYGFVLTDQTYTVTFGWNDQSNDVVLAQTIIDHTQDGDEVYSYDIINAADVSDEQLTGQPGTIVFENARVLPVPETPEDLVDKIGVGIRKQDAETSQPLAGAVYELYTVEAIYDLNGNKLADAGTLLATSAPTNSTGFTWFDVDVPIRGEAYADGETEPADGVWNARYNSGNYQIVEVASPDGYLLDPTPIAVSFTYPGPQTAWQVVAATQADQPLDKLTIHKTDVGGKELPGAELTVTTLEGKPVDSWVSEETPHTLPILEPDAEEQDGAIHYSDEDNEFVYILHEDAAPDGYLVASDIQFKVERDAEGHIVVFTCATAADSWHIVDGASVTMVDAAQPQPTPTPTPTTTVTVTATPTPAPVAHVPQTGDSTPLLAMVIATALAAVGFVALLVMRCRRNRLEEETDPQLEPRDDPEETHE